MAEFFEGRKDILEVTSLVNIENQRRIKLPDIYKNFFEHCSFSIPHNLVGSDLINNQPNLNEWAFEILEENNIENFLTKEDFVFIMHQGYIFFYFKADGNHDPIVFGYSEQENMPKSHGFFSDFIKDFY